MCGELQATGRSELGERDAAWHVVVEVVVVGVERPTRLVLVAEGTSLSLMACSAAACCW
jgi:hypothetical protein